MSMFPLLVSEELIRSCLSESVLNSVQNVSDIVVPSDCLFRVKVELIASGKKIASERFTLHRKSTAKRLVEAVQSSFSGLLSGLDGVLFENLHRAAVDLNTVLCEELAEVTKFEFQVDWDLLIRRNGLDALEKAFDLPENLRTQIFQSTLVLFDPKKIEVFFSKKLEVF